jgi:response regulator NasT
MGRSLRTVIADDDPELCAYCESLLSALGHLVVGTATDGDELIRRCRETRPDLVISDVKMPKKDGIQAVVEVFRESPVRVILVTGYHAPGHIYHALREMVLAYLAKPFQRRELELAIERVDQRFAEFQALFDGGVDPQQAIAHRETLRLAKGVLMKRQQLGDRAAFRRLQDMARDQGQSLVVVAQSVVDAERQVPSPDP